MQYMEFTGKVADWDFVGSRVYPVLLNEENEKALSEEVISEGILDLSIIYEVREQFGESSYVTVKVTEALLEAYGISKEELHRRAMENLKEDGYELLDLEQCILWITGGAMESKAQPVQGGVQDGRMYVLKNASGRHGAAGILDTGLLRSVIGGKDCFILPSSIHETILFPAAGLEKRQEELDNMVAEINSTVVSKGERLSDHIYYYDAQKGELRIWA